MEKSTEKIIEMWERDKDGDRSKLHLQELILLDFLCQFQ